MSDENTTICRGCKYGVPEERICLCPVENFDEETGMCLSYVPRGG